MKTQGYAILLMLATLPAGLGRPIGEPTAAAQPTVTRAKRQAVVTTDGAVVTIQNDVYDVDEDNITRRSAQQSAEVNAELEEQPAAQEDPEDPPADPLPAPDAIQLEDPADSAWDSGSEDTGDSDSDSGGNAVVCPTDGSPCGFGR